MIEGLTEVASRRHLGWPFQLVESVFGDARPISPWIEKLFGPEGSATIVFVIMAIVLLVRPAGLFGREK